MKPSLLIAIAIVLFGCDKDAPLPIGERIPDSTVHLAVDRFYWKNGVRSELPLNIQSMSVENETVVFGGYIHDGADPTNSRMVIYKDGQERNLGPRIGGVVLVSYSNENLFAAYGRWLFKNGTTIPIENIGVPMGIAHLKDDVYMSGSVHGVEYPWMVSPFYPLDTYAICWKNDKVVFRETVHSYANTIFTHGEDIYMGGHRNYYPSLKKVACYWINGQRVELTDQSQDAEVTSMFVTDAHVYSAGVKDDEAVYWIDGHIINMSTSAEPSKAHSISVLGTDVYVAGKEDKYLTVWKNGIKQVIPNSDLQIGAGKVIVAVSNDAPGSPD